MIPAYSKDPKADHASMGWCTNNTMYVVEELHLCAPDLPCMHVHSIEGIYNARLQVMYCHIIQQNLSATATACRLHVFDLFDF